VIRNPPTPRSFSSSVLLDVPDVFITFLSQLTFFPFFLRTVSLKVIFLKDKSVLVFIEVFPLFLSDFLFLPPHRSLKLFSDTAVVETLSIFSPVCLLWFGGAIAKVPFVFKPLSAFQKRFPPFFPLLNS